MSSFETEEQINNLLDTYAKTSKDEQTSLLEEISKELELFLSRKSTRLTAFLSFWEIYQTRYKKNSTNF